MTETMKFFVQVLSTVLFVAAIYFGGFWNVAWAENVAVFWAWFSGIIYLFSVVVDVDKWPVRNKWRRGFHLASMPVEISLMAAAGWFWSAGIFAAGSVILAGKNEEKRAAMSSDGDA